GEGRAPSPALLGAAGAVACGPIVAISGVHGPRRPQDRRARPESSRIGIGPRARAARLHAEVGDQEALFGPLGRARQRDGGPDRAEDGALRASRTLEGGTAPAGGRALPLRLPGDGELGPGDARGGGGGGEGGGGIVLRWPDSAGARRGARGRRADD